MATKLLLLLLILTGLSSCGRACTLKECDDGLYVSFESDAAWYDAEFRLALTTEDGETLCVPVDIENAAGASGTYRQVRCEGDFGASADGRGFSVNGTPSSVALKLEVDGGTLAEEEFAPVYREVEVNGEGCSPVCTQAHHTVIISPSR